MRVAVAGASGFVGGRLCPALEDARRSVRAMTRNPDTYSGAGEPVHGDVQDADSLRDALAGCEAAYYLVHSLDTADFERRDAEAARMGSLFSLQRRATGGIQAPVVTHLTWSTLMLRFLPPLFRWLTPPVPPPEVPLRLPLLCTHIRIGRWAAARALSQSHRALPVMRICVQSKGARKGDPGKPAQRS